MPRIEWALRTTDSKTQDEIQSAQYVRDFFRGKRICPAIVDILLENSQYIDESKLLNLLRQYFPNLTESNLEDFSIGIARGEPPKTFSYIEQESAAVFKRLLSDPVFLELCSELDTLLSCGDEEFCPIRKVHEGKYRELKKGKPPKGKRKLNSTS